MKLLSLSEEYNNRLENCVYDITWHMDTIKTYATECASATELGVANVCATYAFLMAGTPKVTSYDALPIEPSEVDRVELTELAASHNIEYTFIEEDPKTATIDPTDLLFIHNPTTASELDQELAAHGSKASKFIMIPLFSVDRESFMTSIENYVAANPSWSIAENIAGWCDLVILSK
jgi:hypothetical protein